MATRYAVNLELIEDHVGIEKYDIVGMILLDMSARGMTVESIMIEEVNG